MGIETQVNVKPAHLYCNVTISHLRLGILMQDLICFPATLQATYDEQYREFVINTPRDTASKFWIGGAAQHGKVGPSSYSLLASFLLQSRFLASSVLERPPGGGLAMKLMHITSTRQGWPGAQVCTVFAQLTVRGKWEGPHVFVVRIRDDQNRVTPGVRILDNGAKVRGWLLPCWQACPASCFAGPPPRALSSSTRCCSHHAMKDA